MQGDGGRKARLFFALWPNASVRQALAEARDRLPGAGRFMRDDSLHLTLAFIGDVSVLVIPQVLAMASNLRAAPFDFLLDHFGCWRHNRIAYLAPCAPSASLLNLAASLQEGLHTAGVQCDHRTYSPHVTLSRDADCKKTNPALSPICWTARDFVLVRSTLRPTGARYEEIDRWPLLG